MKVDWLQILTTFLWIVSGFVAIYFKEKTKVVQQISEKIAEAEDIYKDYTKAGQEKFNWVCDVIYSYVPAILKPFITREFIGNLVQKVFDSIEAYTTQQLDKVFNKKTV